MKKIWTEINTVFFFLKKISFYKANINWDRNLFKILLLLSSLLFIFILFYVDFQ